MLCPEDGKECWSSGCFFQHGLNKVCSKRNLTVATGGTVIMKEQDASHSLIKNECYWIKIEQWKDRDTRIKDKWSIAKWDGESFEELNEMYRIEEVIEIGEQIPSNAELTRLRSELQQKNEVIVLAYDALSVIRTEPTMSGSVLAGFDKKKFLELRHKFYEYIDTHPEIESTIAKSKAK